MTELKVMVGVAGSGKSTYIESHVTDKDLVLSSDSIRLELFGSLVKVIHLKQTKKHLKFYINV